MLTKLRSVFLFQQLITVALSNRADHYIFALWFLSSVYLSSFFLSSPNLRGHSPQIGCLPYFYTSRSPSANLECRSEICCSRLPASTGRKKVVKNRYLGTIAQLCRAISSQLRHISTIGKNLLSSNTSSTCPYNMVNFGPLAAEIISLVWRTPANFNGFRVLAALLHGTVVVGISQTLRR